MKAQSSHPEREVRTGVRSIPGFSECCPATLHLHTDCRVCQLYFYGPATKPLTKDSSSSGLRSAGNPKTHPLYSRKISAPEERHRQRRPTRQRILSTSQLPEPPTTSNSRQHLELPTNSHQHPDLLSCSQIPNSYLPLNPSPSPVFTPKAHQFLPTPSNPLKNQSSQTLTSSQRPSQDLHNFQDDPSLRPLSAEALVEGRRQEEAATRIEERFLAEQRRERKEVGVRRSVSFAGQRRTYQY